MHYIGINQPGFAFYSYDRGPSLIYSFDSNFCLTSPISSGISLTRVLIKLERRLFNPVLPPVPGFHFSSLFECKPYPLYLSRNFRCVVGGNERVFHTTIELKPIYKADNHVVFGQIGFEVGQVSFLIRE